MVDYLSGSSSPEGIDFEASEAEKKEAQKYCDKLDSLSTKRINFESYWQECMDFIVPRKSDVVSTRMEGDQRNTELFDTTAIFANQLLAAMLHGMLTNPSVRFFELAMESPELNEDEEVVAWLQEVADRMFTIMNGSNFQTEIHEVYIDLGAIGTACIFIGEDDAKVVHFNARAMKEIYVEENNLGLIDTVYRKFTWKPRQVIQEFGEDKLPAKIVEKYRQGCDDDWSIIHAVHPDEKGTYFKFKSAYILKDEKVFLSKGGFKEFPYAVPRWTKTSGETYGRGPGMEMLPDIKMVNAMMETVIVGAQKTVDPPMMVSDDGVIGRVRLTPGGLTVVRPMSDVPIRPLITDARIDFGQQLVESIRTQIRNGFFNNQLQLSNGPQMTATETMQRTEENLRFMGPILGRQHFEFLGPVIERVFGIGIRRNIFPPAPPQAQGRAFTVRYSSLVARAQRMSEGQNLTRAISVAAPIVNMDQSAFDVLNPDSAMKYIFEIYGVPQKLMRTTRDIGDIRDARAQAQAKVAQQTEEQHQADVASKVLPGAAQVAQAQTAQQGQAQ